MATILDIVGRSLRLARVLGVGDIVEADYASDALAELNSMMASWPSRGITYTHSALALIDTFPIDDKFRDAVQFMLGERLAANYGLPFAYGKEASDAFSTIYTGLNTIPTATFDETLLRMPSQRSFRTYGSIT